MNTHFRRLSTKISSVKDQLNDNGSVIVTMKNADLSALEAIKNLLQNYAFGNVTVGDNSVRGTIASVSVTTVDAELQGALVEPENDLIDEFELLDGDEVPEKENDGDCSTKRRACKNCTCGRAEQEAAEEKSAAPAVTSACGNCWKGDAFRCASCPFLGKPAFQSSATGVVTLDTSASDF